MPSIIGHLALPLALQLGLGRRQIPLSAGVVGCALAMAPDLDVIGWHLGINYGAITGHRGFSHSLLVAVGCGLLLAPLWRQAAYRVGLFLMLSMASHGLLDACTTGGKGVALLWPWSEQRWFGPWQVIRVSPLSLKTFFSERGLAVLLSELHWLWLPSCVLAAALYCWRRGRA